MCVALKLLNKYLVIIVYFWVQFRVGLYFKKMFLNLTLLLTPVSTEVNIIVQMHNTVLLYSENLGSNQEFPNIATQIPG